MPLTPINVGAAANDNTGDSLRNAFIKVNNNCTYLDGKAPNAHTHPLSDITQSGAAVGNVPVWNGTAWTPQAGGGALADGNKGDITVSNVGAAWTINSNAVTGDKIAASTISSSKLGSDITSFGKALLVAASAAAQRTSLGLGTAAVVNVPATGDASVTEAVIGSDTRLSNSRTPLSHVHGNISNSGTIGSAANLPLITGASGVVTTGAFGTEANTFCQGNDSRLSDSRTPVSHTHGNITNAGAIGSTANLPLITTTSGVVTTGAFGTAANTFCVGNDSRLSDSRTPTAHTHAASDITSGTLAIGLIPTGSTATTVCIGNDARLSNSRTPTAHTHALSDLTQSSATTGQVIAWNGTAWAPAAASAGSVTSVGLALPNIFTVSNSPVTGSGTLTATFTTQTSGTVLAAPATLNAAPSFRALVASDIPALNYEAAGAVAAHAALTDTAHGMTVYGADFVTAATATAARTKLALGTSATLNVPATGDATAAQVVLGTDTRLTNSRTPTAHVHAAGDITSGTLDIGRIPTGTSAATVCIGNDARLSDSRTPLSHVHGNISNSGAIGSTANLPLITTASGVITTGVFGAAANTFCQGNDSRLSDSRTPTAHTHAVGDLTQSGATTNQVIGWNGTAWAPTTVTSGSGGNISGPNSGITDNAIVRWDTNNTTIQNSVVTISDTGEFVGANSVAFSTSPSGSSAIGKVIWDTTNKTLSLGIGAGSIAALLGVDSHILVRNTTGSQINKGQVVRVNGASSGNMTVALAQGNNDANTTTTIGVAAENIANSGTGMVMVTGLLGGLDTSTWTAGDMLFISATTPGLLVNAAPAAPNHAVRMGYVVSSNPNSGIIYVNVDNGYELDELHDVAYPTAVANNDFLVYTTNRWENKTPANARTALGLGTLATQNGTFSGTSSGTNTGDQTITLTGDVGGSGTGSFAATIAAGAVSTTKLGGDITTAGKALLDDVDAAAQRTTLGLGSLATLSTVPYTSVDNITTSRLLGRTTAGTGAAETLTISNALDLVTTTQGAIAYRAAAQWFGLAPSTSGYVLTTNGAAANPSWGQVNLASAVTGTLPVGNGGTGATTLTGYVKGAGTTALTASSTIPVADVSGLGTGIATFLATPTSANLAAALTDETGTGAAVFATSPALAGTPTSTTAAADTNTTQIATTAYVVGQASATTPAALGTAAVGISLKYARADHVHALPTIDVGTGVTGTLAIANGGTGQTSKTNAFDALAPTTTKGDIVVYDGNDNVRLAVGATNGHVLTIDSATATGLKWAAASGGGGSGGSTNVWIPAAQWIPRTSNGCGIDSREIGATNKVNTDELLFDAATIEYAQAMVVMPSNYNNSTVTARFYWTASSGSGGVAWGVSGRAFGDDDALDQAVGTKVQVNDTLITTNDVHVTAATSAVTIDGTPAANKAIIFEIYRKADDATNDTLGVDARFLGMEISYTAA